MLQAFIIWYLIGMVGVAVAATGVQHGDRASWEPVFYVALFGFVAVGTGGIVCLQLTLWYECCRG